MTELCVSCEFLPLYVLNNSSIFNDPQCNPIFIFYSYKFTPIQQIECTAILAMLSMLVCEPIMNFVPQRN